MSVGPLINVGLSATSSLVIHDLNITVGQFGLLSTVCFLVSALGSIWLGHLSDHISGRAQLLAIFGGAAVALLMAALSPSYLWLMAAVAVSGLSQAMTNPTTNRLIVLHAPAGKRSGWIGIKQSSPQATQLFAGLFFPAVALLVGWKGAVGAASAIVIVLLFWAWNRLPDEPPHRRLRSRSVRHSDGPGGMSAVRRLRPKHGGRVWLYGGQACLASVGVSATNVYLPLFAQRGLGFPLILAGLTTAMVGLVGVAARLFWIRRMTAGTGTDTLLVILAVGSVLSSLLLLFSGQLHIGAMLWAGVILHGTMALGVNVVIMAGVMRDVPAGTAGGATGIVSLGMYLGIASGPLIMGLLLDATGRFLEGWLFLAILNAACSILAGVFRIRSRG